MTIKQVSELASISLGLSNSDQVHSIASTTGYIESHRKNNSIKNNSANFDLTTLTQVKTEVSQTKFYQVNISDYLPINQGFGAYMTTLTKRFSTSTGGDLDDYAMGSGQGKPNGSNVDYAQLNIATQAYQFGIDYTMFDVEQASRLGGGASIQLIRDQEMSTKKTFDLGYQESILNSFSPNNTIQKGLLNQTFGGAALATPITTNTAAVPGFLKDMTYVQFQAAILDMITAFRNLSSGTAAPTTLVLPTAEAGGLALPFENVYGLSKLQIIKNAFRDAFGFEIDVLYSMYNDKARNAAAANFYVLYNKSPDTLEAHMPIPYTSMAYGTADNYNFQSVAIAQITGLTVYRPEEFMYFTHTV